MNQLLKKESRKKYFANYRVRNKQKVQARNFAYNLLKQGYIIRPEKCQVCGCKPELLADGRSGLRMDHENGYERDYWGSVVFKCISCDIIDK